MLIYTSCFFGASTRAISHRGERSASEVNLSDGGREGKSEECANRDSILIDETTDHKGNKSEPGKGKGA